MSPASSCSRSPSLRSFHWGPAGETICFIDPLLYGVGGTLYTVRIFMYSRERTILLRPLQCTVGCHNGKDQNESKVFYRSPLTQRTSADSFPCLLLRDINCYWSDHISTTTTATLYCPACPLDTLLQSGRGMEREERREGPTTKKLRRESTACRRAHQLLIAQLSSIG